MTHNEYLLGLLDLMGNPTGLVITGDDMFKYLGWEPGSKVTFTHEDERFSDEIFNYNLKCLDLVDYDKQYTYLEMTKRFHPKTHIILQLLDSVYCGDEHLAKISTIAKTNKIIESNLKEFRNGK